VVPPPLPHVTADDQATTTIGSAEQPAQSQDARRDAAALGLVGVLDVGQVEQALQLIHAADVVVVGLRPACGVACRMGYLPSSGFDEVGELVDVDPVRLELIDDNVESALDVLNDEHHRRRAAEVDRHCHVLVAVVVGVGVIEVAVRPRPGDE
jgi:hypothetical protein